ncbi:hypothetical protein E1A91_D10G253900v1, partial [Gossypium mustelinum]
TKGKRVLYAEAGKDFIDFLFDLFLLPVKIVIWLLANQTMVGCLANLYDNIENLGDAYILPTTNKDALLKPKFSSILATDHDPTSTCPFYSGAMNSPTTLVNHPNKVSTLLFDANEGGYIKGVVTYKIMNDLTVTLMLTISSITMLNKLNLQQVDVLEEKVIDVDINEKDKKLLKPAIFEGCL